jgi:hypothetical protein
MIATASCGSSREAAGRASPQRVSPLRRAPDPPVTCGRRVVGAERTAVGGPWTSSARPGGSGRDVKALAGTLSVAEGCRYRFQLWQTFMM